MPQVMRHTVYLTYTLVTLSAYPLSVLRVPSNILVRRRLEEAYEFGADDLVPFEFVVDTGVTTCSPKARGRHRSGHRQERVQRPMRGVTLSEAVVSHAELGGPPGTRRICRGS